MNRIIDAIEKDQFKAELPAFRVGDSIRVHTRVVEGDKERIQVFSGTVIMKKGSGINETFPVRRIVNNEGVERIFPLHSPFISKVADGMPFTIRFRVPEGATSWTDQVLPPAAPLSKSCVLPARRGSTARISCRPIWILSPSMWPLIGPFTSRPVYWPVMALPFGSR